jgi:hypothetical protein
VHVYRKERQINIIYVAVFYDFGWKALTSNFYLGLGRISASDNVGSRNHKSISKVHAVTVQGFHLSSVNVHGIVIERLVSILGMRRSGHCGSYQAEVKRDGNLHRPPPLLQKSVVNKYFVLAVPRRDEVAK